MPRASSSIAGPTSVASSAGLPITSSCMCPISSSMTRSAISVCRHKSRNAEHLCPALLKAENTASFTTCSGSAELSTNIAFWPPVSAISVPMAPSRPASVRLISRAVSVDPVNATPAILGSATARPPTDAPSPGRNCSTSRGTPALIRSSTARNATSGVCSAGFARTALPAASAAATWPVKMASGKFHGLMQTNTPRPRIPSVLRSPVGPGSCAGSPKYRRASAA